MSNVQSPAQREGSRGQPGEAGPFITFHVLAAPQHSEGGSRFTRPLLRNTQHAIRSERGIALVVTLILLSVITFMAIAFLFLTRTERSNVDNSTQQLIAEIEAGNAEHQAIAEAVSDILASTNEFNYGLRVSTNYTSAVGFDYNAQPAPPLANITNVNYDHDINGLPLKRGNPDYWLANIANLQLSPAPPVFIVTNKTLFPLATERRSFLDLNRNNVFEPTGLLPVVAPSGAYYDTNGVTPPVSGIASNYFVGDPQWIGDLQYPDRPHGPNNLFVGRHAYLVCPAGQTVDINYAHNYARLAGTDMRTGDYFLRNQGVATWEQNLAGLLVDVNTNAWPHGVATALGQPYQYSPAYTATLQPGAGPNQGSAFDDALALLRYRYAGNVSASAVYDFFNVSQIFGAPGAAAFGYDGIDEYCSGTIMTNTSWFPPGGVDSDLALVNNTIRGWPGSPNTNHFFTTQDLFDKSKIVNYAPGYYFSDRLSLVSSNLDSYDRYTFYRLLGSLGSDSASEPPKLNVNYVNVDANGNIVPGMATNFIPWIPTNFFNNAAVRLLQNAGYSTGLGPTNMLLQNNNGLAGFHIQVYPTNFYTPNVHRLLQLAANIYDATTVRPFGVPTAATNGFPTVFRPIFRSSQVGSNNYVFITGYVEVSDTTLATLNPAYWLDLNLPGDRGNIKALVGGPVPSANEPMVYGFPLVIGAKKGFPGFNALGALNTITVTRNLIFTRNNYTPGTAGGPDTMYQEFTLTNNMSLGVDAWNPYRNPFPRSLTVLGSAESYLSISNQAGVPIMLQTNVFQIGPTTVPNWPGFQGINVAPPVSSQNCMLGWGTTSIWANAWSHKSGAFVPVTTDYRSLENPMQFPVPQWYVNTRIRLRLFIVDPHASPPRIVDFVNLDRTAPAPSTVRTNGQPLDLISFLANDISLAQSNSPASANANGAPLGIYWSQTPYSISRSGTVGPGPVDSAIAPIGIINQMAQNEHSIQTIDWGPGNDLQYASEWQCFGYRVGKFSTQYCTNANTFTTPHASSRNLYAYTSLQANDPMVHYTMGDLAILGATNGTLTYPMPTPVIPGFTTNINVQYQPWGRASLGGVTPTTVQDPVVTANRFTHPDACGTSDDWDPPTNKLPHIGWLGRIHRGSPWQTVYLKSSAQNLPLGNWEVWSRHAQSQTNFGQIARLPVYNPNLTYLNNLASGAIFQDGLLSHPTNDWAILDLFTTSFCDSATRGQLSINQQNMAAWSAALAGVNVLSNINSSAFIEPSGAYNPAAPSPIAQIVAGINSSRTNFVNGAFHRLGDVLSAPQLTDSSPYLTPGSSLVNDEVLERIPQQILGLLKCDHTPRFVIYSYGQALKPANNSLVTSGPYSGLCTNYQITAEVCTRAVVRVDGAPTAPHPVIEQFNIIPSD